MEVRLVWPHLRPGAHVSVEDNGAQQHADAVQRTDCLCTKEFVTSVFAEEAEGAWTPRFRIRNLLNRELVRTV